MPDGENKKSIWNRLLAIVIVLVAALSALALYMSYEQERSLDIFSPYPPGSLSSADNETADTFASEFVRSRAFEDMEGFEPTGGAERIALFDTDTNSVLYAHSVYEKAYPASLTKIMTALLAIKYGNMEEVVTMEAVDYDLEEGSQNSNMVAGDKVTMDQLLKLMLVYSANDAANAIARTVSGSVEAFVNLMNEEARQLGMTGTHFMNPHGLHDDEHYTCAYDVYLMLNAAMDYPKFNEIIRMSSYMLDVTRGDSVVSYYYESTDEFLTGLKAVPEGVVLWGGKTGTTPQAGACLALIAQNEKGVPYIAVIMNADKKTILYDDMSALLSHINDEYDNT